MKACSKCLVVKPLDDFINDFRLKSGKGSKCKECQALYYQKRKSEGKIPKRTDNQLARQRVKSSEWSKKNRDKKRANYRRWSADNREYDRLRGHVRRLKIRTRAFTITKKEMRRLYRQSCFLCGSNNRIEADHIIPIAKGGRHSIGNLLPLCRNCNAKKSDKLLVYLRYANHLERN